MDIFITACLDCGSVTTAPDLRSAKYYANHYDLTCCTPQSTLYV